MELQFPLLIPLLIIFSLPSALSLSFNYSSLGTSVEQELIIKGGASYQPDFVQLTNSSAGAAAGVFNVEQLHLWDSSTKEAASFNCSFQFIIKPAGDGLTFVLLNPVALVNLNDNAVEGYFLGLFNTSVNSNIGYSFFAIEFDAYKNSFDPNANHIGIDNNTVISEDYNKDLPFNIASSTTIFCWVDYSGSDGLLTVYATNLSSTKPSSPLISFFINFTELLPDSVYIGFTAATGSSYATQLILSWSFSSTSLMNSTTIGNPPQPPKGSNIGLFVGLGMGILAGLAIIVLIGLRMRRRKRQRLNWTMQSAIDMSGLPSPEGGYGPGKFNYKDLCEATNNFGDKNLLGQGGFGPVYKGVLSEDRSEVAVKCISQRSSQGEKEFFAEVSIISRIRHKNLVKLKGWCRDKGNLLLVYEFLPNGSLDTYLFSKSSSLILDWSTRYNIVCGLGSALQYLHQECEKVIVHRDIKASNVMLDTNYNAKLGDFGLARQLGEGVEGHTTLVAGTMGYMAPESYGTGRATPESDVYSYGIVLLEVVCGRRPVDMSLPAQFDSLLLDWVWDFHSKGRLREVSDTRLEGAFNEEELVRALIVGLACSHPDPKSRPSVHLALDALQGRAPLPTIPTSKPVAYYGPLPSISLFTTTMTSSSCPPISFSSSAPDTDLSEKALLHEA